MILAVVAPQQILPHVLGGTRIRPQLAMAVWHKHGNDSVAVISLPIIMEATAISTIARLATTWTSHHHPFDETSRQVVRFPAVAGLPCVTHEVEPWTCLRHAARDDCAVVQVPMPILPIGRCTPGVAPATLPWPGPHPRPKCTWHDKSALTTTLARNNHELHLHLQPPPIPITTFLILHPIAIRLTGRQTKKRLPKAVVDHGDIPPFHPSFRAVIAVAPHEEVDHTIIAHCHLMIWDMNDLGNWNIPKTLLGRADEYCPLFRSEANPTTNEWNVRDEGGYLVALRCFYFPYLEQVVPTGIIISSIGQLAAGCSIYLSMVPAYNIHDTESNLY